MIKFISSFFLVKKMKHLLLEKISKKDMLSRMKELYSYMKEKLSKIDRDPIVKLNYNQENADDFLGKTGFYDPKSEEIHLFITDRHAKDVLRSFAHEVVHHEQNCSGYTATVDMSKTHEADYASKDKKLRFAEKDAFTRGNMLFRDWTDTLKSNREKGKKLVSEKKENNQSDYMKKRKEAITKAIEDKKGKKTKKEEKSCSPKKQVESAKNTAKKEARKHMKHLTGKDEKMHEQEALEKLSESVMLPIAAIQPLFEPKERILQKSFDKREEQLFNSLLEKFGIKKDVNK